jgi:Toprim-like
MANLSTIELVPLIECEVGGAIRFGEEVGKDDTRKGGPCPFCGLGEDRFAVFTADMPQHFKCGVHGTGCGMWGDAITFIREYRHMDYFEACEYLDVEPDSKYEGSYRRKEDNEDAPPVEAWQKAAMEFCKGCKSALHSQERKKALAWLTNTRGLTEKIIDVYGLGYNAVSRQVESAEWGITLPEGKKIWLPRGFIFPFQIDGNLWKITIRRPDHDIAADCERYAREGRKGKPPKYVEVSGGSQGLYGVNEIRPGEPLVIVEGPIDKLIFTQQVGRCMPCVATGSTGQSHAKRWVEEIRKAFPVLVAYDFDENNRAGDNSAKHWREQLQQAIRWSPWAHDINDMFLQGIDLNIWLETGLEVAALIQAQQAGAEQVKIAMASEENAHIEQDGSVAEVATPVAEPIPPLCCRKCHNTDSARWSRNLLRNRWQCADCGELALGYVSYRRVA